MLMLLAVNDREVWVEVGYDLEGIITDGFAGETSRETMVPFFRNGDYGGGLLAGATRFAQRIAEGRDVTLEGLPARAPARPRDSGGIPLGVWIFLAIVLLNIFGRTRRRRGWAGVRALGSASARSAPATGWSRGGWGSAVAADSAAASVAAARWRGGGGQLVSGG